MAYLEETLRDPQGPDTKEAAALYAHPVFGRYLKRSNNGKLSLDRAKVRDDARYDGKDVVHTSHRSLSTEAVARAYRQRMLVERSFRSLNSLRELEPVYHYKDRRISGHGFICVLAHLLERVLERRLGQGGLDELTASRALRTLDRVQLVPTTVKDRTWLVRTELSPEATAIFQALRYRIPPKLQELGAVGGASGAKVGASFSRFACSTPGSWRSGRRSPARMAWATCSAADMPVRR